MCLNYLTYSQKQSSTAILLVNTYGEGKHVVILPHTHNKKKLFCNKPLNNLVLLPFKSAYLMRIRNGSQAK